MLDLRNRWGSCAAPPPQLGHRRFQAASLPCASGGGGRPPAPRGAGRRGLSRQALDAPACGFHRGGFGKRRTP
eukprot:6180409-Lingulodinium_polyedra.AAC.1